MSDHDPPMIRVSIAPAGPGLYSVTTPDSGATLVDRTPNPVRAAAVALGLLGWGEACLLGILPMTLSIAKDL